jgi:hypothetical protein
MPAASSFMLCRLNLQIVPFAETMRSRWSARCRQPDKSKNLAGHNELANGVCRIHPIIANSLSYSLCFVSHSRIVTRTGRFACVALVLCDLCHESYYRFMDRHQWIEFIISCNLVVADALRMTTQTLRMGRVISVRAFQTAILIFDLHLAVAF